MMTPERILEMRNNPKAPYYVVYEDGDALLVYKKRDVLSVATLDKKTYVHNLQAYLGHYAKESHEQVYLIHRLDVETSGLMIFAKSKTMQEKIKACFEARTVERYYEAVVKESLPIGKVYDVKQYLAEEGMHDHSNDWGTKYTSSAGTAYVGYGVKSGKELYYAHSDKRGWDIIGGSLATLHANGKFDLTHYYVQDDSAYTVYTEEVTGL